MDPDKVSPRVQAGNHFVNLTSIAAIGFIRMDWRAIGRFAILRELYEDLQSFDANARGEAALLSMMVQL